MTRGGAAKERPKHRLHDIIGVHSHAQGAGRLLLRERPQSLGVAQVERCRRVAVAAAKSYKQRLIGAFGSAVPFPRHFLVLLPLAWTPARRANALGNTPHCL